MLSARIAIAAYRIGCVCDAQRLNTDKIGPLKSAFIGISLRCERSARTALASYLPLAKEMLRASRANAVRAGGCSAHPSWSRRTVCCSGWPCLQLRRQLLPQERFFHSKPQTDRSIRQPKTMRVRPAVVAVKEVDRHELHQERRR
jgi:hypothetical protein